MSSGPFPVNPQKLFARRNVWWTAGVAIGLGLGAAAYQHYFRTAGRTAAMPVERQESENDLNSGAGSQDARRSLEFTHKLPPVIAADQPDLQIALPVVNQTNETVCFDSVTHSCSCTDAQLRGKTLQPAEQTTLDVSLNVRGRDGPQRLAVHLIEASGRWWNYFVEVTVYQRARFDVAQKALHIPMQDPDTRIERDVVLELFSSSRDTLPADPRCTTQDPRLAVRVSAPEVSQLADGICVRRVPVHLSFATPVVPGPYHMLLTADYAYQGASEEVRLGISGSVQSLYEIAPQYVFFGEVAPDGGMVTKKVIIRRTDGQPLVIEKVRSSSAAMTATVEDSPNKAMSTLVLSLDSREVKEAFSGEVEIHTNHKKQPRLKVQCAAFPRMKD